MKVTQPWQDELADLAQELETKLTEFKETKASIGKMLTEQITTESLEQAKGSVAEINAEHDKLQDIYTWWYDKMNKTSRRKRSRGEVRRIQRNTGLDGKVAHGTSHDRIFGAG